MNDRKKAKAEHLKRQLLNNMRDYVPNAKLSTVITLDPTPGRMLITLFVWGKQQRAASVHSKMVFSSTEVVAWFREVFKDFLPPNAKSMPSELTILIPTFTLAVKLTFYLKAYQKFFGLQETPRRSKLNPKNQVQWTSQIVHELVDMEENDDRMSIDEAQDMLADMLEG